MQISSRFTIAIHSLAVIYLYQDQQRVTSNFLAESIQVNPVVVRSVLSGLKAAGIIESRQGSGGSRLAKPLDAITFYDIYVTVDSVDKEGLFNFHPNPHQDCPVGRNIHQAVDGKLIQIQTAMENELKRLTMQDVVEDLEKAIAQSAQSSK